MKFRQDIFNFKMKRTLAIGDIHGAYKALIQVLERAAITSEDTLIFLGDYVDGWSESAQVINYLIELQKKYSCIFIRGNHDAWCANWLKGEATDRMWLSSGGKSTINSYYSLTQEEKINHLVFFNNMINIFCKSFFIQQEV